MKRVLILTVVLGLGGGCAAPNNIAGKNQTQGASTPLSSPLPVASPEPTPEAEKKNEAPAEFRHVDFRSMSYSVSLIRKTIKLKDGKFEYREGMRGNSYELEDVYYADLNNDGHKEAIAHLFQLSCGGSCDGGTDIFYFYSMSRRKISLLNRLEIGSFAYDCGLKSFTLENELLTLETFRSCRFTGSSFIATHDDANEQGDKLLTNRYTQFRLHFNGNRLVQQSRRVFSYPEPYDFRLHERQIEIK